MSNPFNNQFDSRCGMCEGFVGEGDQMFAHEGQFICSSCANNEDLVCSCGNYKKAEYDECFDCFNN